MQRPRSDRLVLERQANLTVRDILWETIEILTTWRTSAELHTRLEPLRRDELRPSLISNGLGIVGLAHLRPPGYGGQAELVPPREAGSWEA